jgi:ABC-2 type transport system ATP-binding protein
MMLRLAYSVAIQVPFDILLLDEVLAVGDQEFQDKCLATLDELRSTGKTIVFVSHDLGSIRDHCDRAVLIERGVVQALGPADQVVDTYLGLPTLA